MPSTRDFERDQASQEVFDNDQERIDRFTDRAAHSVHRPGIIERLRSRASFLRGITVHDLADLLDEPADLLEEIREELSNRIQRAGHNASDNMSSNRGESLAQAAKHDTILDFHDWLDAKLEGK